MFTSSGRRRKPGARKEAASSLASLTDYMSLARVRKKKGANVKSSMGKESKESKKKSKHKKKHSKKHKHKEKKHKHSKKRRRDETSSSESDTENSSSDSGSESSRARERASKKRKVENEDTAKRRKSDPSEKQGDAKEAHDEALVKLAAQLKKQEEEEKAAKRRRMAPMSLSDHQQKESELRRIFDEDTGRWRLVRGSGEIVEEIVSKEQQKRINKMATFGDGYAYQKAMGLDPTYKP